MSPLAAAILGLVEGITEYLPISSTGHLILAAWLLGLDRDPAQKPALDAFTIIIQGGAILAVLGLYRGRVRQMILGLLGRDPAGRRLAINLVIAFIPAAVLGPLLDDHIERLLFHPGPVLAALGLGGVLLIALGPWQRRAFARDASREHAIDQLRPVHALLIGLAQCVAMWPGTSRSMATIVGGMAVGMKPKDAAEFSFLLGLPTLGGACVYKIAKSIMHGDGTLAAIGWTNGAIGIAVALVSAALAVKWLVGFLQTHGVAVFGWYRIALAVALGVLMAGGMAL